MNLLKKILPKDSFYLILFICVGVLGASAVWVSKDKLDAPEKLEVKEETIEQEIKLDLKEENVSKERVQKSKKEIEAKAEKKLAEEKEYAEKSAIKKEIKTETKTEKRLEQKPVEKQQTSTKSNTDQVKVQSTEKPEQTQAVASGGVKVKNIKLKRPVEGKIYKDFANDKLVYSKTLEEWSVHLGIDIVAKEGTDVKAALDGIVKTVDKDEKLGITIVLDHGNGLETVYKNISTENMVKIGQKVKTGQVISKVSRGIGFEKLDEPHIHFEVLESGTQVDPKGFF